MSPGGKLLLEDAGLSATNVLRRAELPADLFARESAALSTVEYFRLWRGMDEESADSKLPLRIGAAISAEAFDPPIFATLCSPELNTALARLAHYKRLIASMALHVDVGDDTTTLELEWLDKTALPPRCLVLAELVFFVQLARMATRARVCPLEVRSPDLPEHPHDYTEYFGVPVQYAAAPRIAFSAEDASRPFLTANEKMWECFEPELKTRLDGPNPGKHARGHRPDRSLASRERAPRETHARELGTQPKSPRSTASAHSSDHFTSAYRAPMRSLMTIWRSG